MKQLVSRLLMLVVTVIWGAGYVVSSVGIQAISPYQLIASRFLIAFILSLLFFFKALKDIKKSTLIRGSMIGVTLFLAFIFQTVGLAYTTPSKNAFLTAAGVVLVPFISSVFFKNKVPLKAIFGALFTFVGSALLSLDQISGLNLGDILTLICAVCFALQTIFSGLYVKHENVQALTIVQLGAAAISGLVTLLIRGEGYNFSSKEANLSVLYLALFGTFIAYFIQSVALRFISDSEAMIIASLESLWGMVLSILILNEWVTVQMLIGAFFILSGSIVAQLNFAKIKWPRRKVSAESVPHLTTVEQTDP